MGTTVTLPSNVCWTPPAVRDCCCDESPVAGVLLEALLLRTADPATSDEKGLEETPAADRLLDDEKSMVVSGTSFYKHTSSAT